MLGLVKKDFILYTKKNHGFLKLLAVYGPLLALMLLVDNVDFMLLMFNTVNLPIEWMTICIDLREMDRNYKVDKRLDTYPISKSKIVLSRYVSALALGMVHVGLTLILNILLILIKQVSVSLVLTNFATAVLLGLMILSVMMITSYVSNTTINGFVMLTIIGAYLLYIFNQEAAQQLVNKLITLSSQQMGLLMILLATLFLLASYVISYQSYSRQTYS